MIQDVEVKSYKRWFFGYIPAIVFTVLSIISLYYFSIYFLTYKTEVSLRQWSCEGKISQDSDWDVTFKKLLIANRLNPWDADIYLGLGALLEWKASNELEFNNTNRQIRSEAITYYKKAINHRPTWAMAWLNLAQSMLLNRELNTNTFQAIEMAFKYGKWQPEINKKLLWMSIGIWGSIPENLKDVVRQQVKFKLDNNEPISNLAAIAIRYKWLDELEKLVTTKKDKDYLELVKENPKLLKGAIKNSLASDKEFVC